MFFWCWNFLINILDNSNEYKSPRRPRVVGRHHGTDRDTVLDSDLLLVSGVAEVQRGQGLLHLDQLQHVDDVSRVLLQAEDQLVQRRGRDLERVVKRGGGVL